MFTIQYQGTDGNSRMQEVDTYSRARVAKHLANFQHPILAVYEGSTLISKAMRTEIKLNYRLDQLSPECLAFIKSPA